MYFEIRWQSVVLGLFPTAHTNIQRQLAIKNKNYINAFLKKNKLDKQTDDHTQTEKKGAGGGEVEEPRKSNLLRSVSLVSSYNIWSPCG